MSKLTYKFEEKFGFLRSETVYNNDITSTIELLVDKNDIDGTLTIFEKLENAENFSCIIFSKEQVEWLRDILNEIDLDKE